MKIPARICRDYGAGLVRWGKITKVDVSTDGGESWKEAKLQAPVLSKAHTRFNFDWLGTDKRR